MILQLALALGLMAPPDTLHITTARGETSVPISHERGSAVAAPLVAGPLDLAVVIEGARATVVMNGAGFIFALGSPFARIGTRMCQLVGESYVARDTLFLPLVWLTDCVPSVFGGRFRWDAVADRLSEMSSSGVALIATDTAPVQPADTPAGARPAVGNVPAVVAASTPVPPPARDPSPSRRPPSQRRFARNPTRSPDCAIGTSS